MVALIVEPTYEATKTTEVPSLRGAVFAGRAESLASAVLFQAGLPEGEQGREPASLAPVCAWAGLLPGCGQRGARPGVAEGASGLLA